MLFTKEFLDELQEKCGAKTMLNHYIDEQGMSFHDAVLRLAKFHDIEPKYARPGYSMHDDALRLLIDTYLQNIKAKPSE